jgi:hypothetical protein
MDKFLSQIPKNILAVVLVVGGILGIVLWDPPKSVCDSQIQKFQKMQINFLYRDEKNPKAKKVVTRKYKYLYELCHQNDSGACYEYFNQLRIMLHDLEAFDQECKAAPGQIAEVNAILWPAWKLMVQLAWGDKPPTAYNAKFGWLDAADINLFCKLKHEIHRVYGEQAYNQELRKFAPTLPGAKELTFNQIWDMAIFSENCARYP